VSIINRLENEIHNQGYKYIACIDEVGRGCLLGDVLAAAVILPKGLIIHGVKDSKKLSQKKREYLYDIILDNAIGIGIGRIGPSTIDRINIKESTKLAMKMSIENIRDKTGEKLSPDYVLVDAEQLDINLPNKSIIKGDSVSHGIACASIIAKVYRDRLCLEWDKELPIYNIKQHKGYGTKEHRNNIKKFGASSMHRKTFLKNILK